VNPFLLHPAVSAARSIMITSVFNELLPVRQKSAMPALLIKYAIFFNNLAFQSFFN
jgi:hypothetical protein